MDTFLRSVRHTAIYFVVLISLSACSDVTPEVTMLKSLEGFELNSPQVVTSDLSSISVVAKCSYFIYAVELSFDEGSTWIRAEDYDNASTTECISQKEFQVTLTNSKAPWSSMSISPGDSLKVKFKALSRLGSSVYQDLQVLFSSGLGVSQETLIGAAPVQTGGGLQLRSRLRYQKQDVASGGSYILKGRILQ